MQLYLGNGAVVALLRGLGLQHWWFFGGFFFFSQACNMQRQGWRPAPA